MDKEYLKRRAKIELARREFFYYCNAIAPDFYTPDRAFLVNQCRDFQDFVESDEYEVLIVNEPPRFGKSRTSQMFVQWLLGKDNRKKIMTGSYNTKLSTMFSKNVRNAIQEVKADEKKIIFSDVFPDVKIKAGDGSMNLWSLEGGYNNYLATSPRGTATGFGADLIIVDDLIKNAYEAHNEATKEEHWQWFTDTMLSRLEEGGKIIIVMTRWASDDLAGRALDHFTKLGRKVKHINYKAIQDDGTLLCESILSHRSIELKKATMGVDIFNANYQQKPIDLKGRLYGDFLTYKEIPCDNQGNPLFKYILNYTDTADKGSDHLASVCYGMYGSAYYILDVLFTKDSMETTEPETAKMLTRNNVGCAIIESNNGGEGFARNVKRECKEMGNNHTNVKTFHQSKNKEARILSNSASVMKNLLFPWDWKERWPDFYDALRKYQREGKNDHDDAPDCITGVYEHPKPLGSWMV